MVVVGWWLGPHQQYRTRCAVAWSSLQCTAELPPGTAQSNAPLASTMTVTSSCCPPLVCTAVLQCVRSLPTQLHSESREQACFMPAMASSWLKLSGCMVRQSSGPCQLDARGNRAAGTHPTGACQSTLLARHASQHALH